MNKKIRYPFKKVALWVVIINLAITGFSLTVIFLVKTPYQADTLKLFSVRHFFLASTVSLIFQIIFDYFALNRYYRLLAAKSAWKKYILPPLLLFAGGIICYLISDVIR